MCTVAADRQGATVVFVKWWLWGKGKLAKRMTLVSVNLWSKHLSSVAGKDVMFYVAEMIPKLKTRTQKSGGGDMSSQQGEGGKKSKKKKK